MKRIILFTIFVCCGLSMYAQKARYYVHIPNKQDVPVATSSIGTKESKVVLQSANMQLSKTMNNYNVTKFKQAFPNAVTNWLREVYYVECDSINTTTKMSFTEAVSAQFKESIPLIEELGEPMPTGSSGYTPNDPKFTSGLQGYLELIRAPEAWDITRRYSNKIDVAVHDLVFASHEDLNYKSILYNVQPNKQTSTIHGAFVAGCLGATTGNNKGIASLGGYNTNLVVTTKDWADDNGVLELARKGYKVINCSWFNAYSHSSIIATTYKEIRDIHNTVVVFGAGNGKWNGTEPHTPSDPQYPASYESVLSVTSVGYKNAVGHSGNQNWKDVHEYIIGNGDKIHQHNSYVDICAPGYELLSTYQNSYLESSGTSFAAPLVAATAAMIRVVNPSLTAKQVIDIIKSTADASIYNIPQNSKYRGLLGTGRLDAYEAVRKACAVDLANKTFSNETYNGCIITIKNSRIPASRTLTLYATKEANFEGSFTIDSGGVLNITQ